MQTHTDSARRLATLRDEGQNTAVCWAYGIPAGWQEEGGTGAGDGERRRVRHKATILALTLVVRVIILYGLELECELT